ncbi:MAG: ATP synthase F1 subunit gamma [Chloroflexi bacterium]|nr:ATP synthase F1 subunit gamma [Chloroflexota bacterium]
MPESPRDIRRRIQSTKNIAQITRAFQQLATARLRRAQSRASESRPYADSIREVLAGLAGAGGSDVTHPLLEAREVGTVGIIEVTPDRGLVGGLIANVNRTVSRFVVEQSHPVRGYALGRRGRDFLRRSGVELAGEEINLGDYPEIERILGVARIVIDEYTDGTVDQVHLAYTRYISTVRQESTIIQLIPVQPAQESQEGQEGEDGGAAIQYEYEPDPAAVLNSLLPRYIETQIYRAVLESKASEQAARLVAMRNATDNANELVGDYTLSLNKARQASITTEIAEISAAAEALR